ncbi:MAG TPA: hypothetical protein VFZ31_10300 [Vicinamibacterales bacterium]
MKRLLICGAALLTALPALAQDRTIGLLSLPEVFGPRQCAPFEPQQVALHASPNDGSPFAFIRVDQNWSFAPHGGCEGLEVSVHQGQQRGKLPTLEFDYEMPGAVVVEHRDGWFRIRLDDRTAWVKASLAGRFMALGDLYEEFVGVTTISESFSGRLTSAAGSTSGPIMPAVVAGQPVRVIEIRDSWIQVEMMSNSACTAADDGPPEVVATGWLPLHDREGKPTVWFSSRGC